jgi:hypothetical protein
MTEIVIRWVPEDLKKIHPDWSRDQCEAALEKVSKQLVSQSIDSGWAVLENQFKDGLWHRLSSVVR